MDRRAKDRFGGHRRPPWRCLSWSCAERGAGAELLRTGRSLSRGYAPLHRTGAGNARRPVRGGGRRGLPGLLCGDLRLSRGHDRGTMSVVRRHPDWIKVRAPGGGQYAETRTIVRGLGLHTVCEEAMCPNLAECWGHGTATFMLMGEVCTRACTYCAVAHGRPGPLDAA